MSTVDDRLDVKTRENGRLNIENCNDEEEEKDDDNRVSDSDSGDGYCASDHSVDNDDHSDSAHINYGLNIEEGRTRSSLLFSSQVCYAVCFLYIKSAAIFETVVQSMNFFINRTALGPLASSFREDLVITGYYNERLFASKYAQQDFNIIINVMRIPEMTDDMIIIDSNEFTRFDQAWKREDVLTLRDWSVLSRLKMIAKNIIDVFLLVSLLGK